MPNRNCISAWLAACRELTRDDDVPGFRQLPWLQRKRVDHLILWRGVCSEGFWRASIVVIGLGLAALIICWHWDLAGWRRDLLRGCPSLVAIPWLAAARKRHRRELFASARQPSRNQ